jgi:transcriptional regulator with XRE-family HTH domain
MDISAKLKELRAGSGKTQEALAAFLGVTAQAVSRWERGEGLPDITMLPSIAGFYGVTTDEVLGVDRRAANKATGEFLQKYTRAKTWEERFRLTADVLSNYPNNRSILGFLAQALTDSDGSARFLDENGKEIPAPAPETTEDARRFIASLTATHLQNYVEHCDSDDYFDRFFYTMLLARAKMHSEGEAAARAAASKLPAFPFWYQSSALSRVLTGEKKLIELHTSISFALGALNQQLILLGSSDDVGYTPEERIEVLRLMREIEDIVDGADYRPKFQRLQLDLNHFAALYLETGQTEKLLDMIDEYVDACIAFDIEDEKLGWSPNHQFTRNSLLTKYTTNDNQLGYYSDTQSKQAVVFLGDKRFDVIRDHARFKAAIERARPYADKVKPDASVYFGRHE